MLNVYLPQPLYGEHRYERLITADLTLSGHRLCLYPAQYPDFSASVDEVELRAEGHVLKGRTLGVPEPLAYEFELPDGVMPQAVQVRVRGVHAGRLKVRDRAPGPKVFLTAATLFKNDYAQLEAWVDYHAREGFERFVLYYNGEADAILPELMRCEALTSRDVLLIPWPHAYWVEGLGLGVEGLLAEHGEKADLSRRSRDWHHAQQLMLNHALVFLRGTTEYLAFFDLDEYFRMSGPRHVADFVRAHDQDIFIFQSRWSELASQHVPGWGDGGDFFANHQVLASPDWVPFPARTKYIARPEVVFGTGAHVPKATSGEARMVRVPTDMAGIYHFHCFSGKAPRRNLINPQDRWVEVADFLLPRALTSRAA